ncbi:hypothetical protein Tco_0887794, partial [Tanacetum coccineum]
IQRISLTGFPAQSVGSSNTDVLDSPCLLVLITGTSQSRQHDLKDNALDSLLQLVNFMVINKCILTLCPNEIYTDLFLALDSLFDGGED